MKPIVRDRYSEPYAQDRKSDDVSAEDIFGTSETEAVPRAMDAQAEWRSRAAADEATPTGDSPPLIDSIRSALSQLTGAATDQTSDARADGSAWISGIVAAISGDSQVDGHVCNLARKLANTVDAHVHFVSVVNHVEGQVQYGALGPIEAGFVPPEIDAQTQEEAIEQRKRLFNAFAGKQDMPAKYSFDVVEGLIDDEIIACANKRDASVIIVGSSDRSWLEGLLFSDVAQQVTKKADRPVLVVPEP